MVLNLVYNTATLVALIFNIHLSCFVTKTLIWMIFDLWRNLVKKKIVCNVASHKSQSLSDPISGSWNAFVFCVGKGEVQMQLDSALQDVNTRYAVLEETEKRAVCRALIEERGRFCSFVTMLKPVLVSVWTDSCLRYILFVLTIETF